MTRYCCPECEDHILLDEILHCVVCDGRYEWVSKRNKEISEE